MCETMQCETEPCKGGAEHSCSRPVGSGSAPTGVGSEAEQLCSRPEAKGAGAATSVEPAAVETQTALGNPAVGSIPRYRHDVCAKADGSEA